MIRIEDVDALLEQAEEDRRQRYAAADAEFAAVSAAVKKIKKMLLRRNPVAAIPKLPESEQAPEHQIDHQKANVDPWPGLRAAIRHLISKYPELFTLDDVMQDLMNHYRQSPKRVIVSGELWRMNRNGELEIVEKGAGSRPNAYRKIEKKAEESLVEKF
jgi:hypothetical protein